MNITVNSINPIAKTTQNIHYNKMQSQKLSAATMDTFTFTSKKEEYTTISCKEADNLRYDVEYTKPSAMKGNFEISGDEIELVVKNKMNGVREITGTAYDKEINIKLDSGILGSTKGKLTGTIDNTTLDLKYKGNNNSKKIQLAGNLEQIEDKFMPLITMLISDKIKADIKAEELLMILVATSA